MNRKQLPTGFWIVYVRKKELNFIANKRYMCSPFYFIKINNY